MTNLLLGTMNLLVIIGAVVHNLYRLKAIETKAQHTVNDHLRSDHIRWVISRMVRSATKDFLQEQAEAEGKAYDV